MFKEEEKTGTRVDHHSKITSILERRQAALQFMAILQPTNKTSTSNRLATFNGFNERKKKNSSSPVADENF